ncbi:MAG TPA: hypothetical protein VFG69_01615 [Nannocystaceae bacterium]|nr:hypothetical protein [Nannocystaceae bacterium]
MASTYKRQSLTGQGQSPPAPGVVPLTGLQPMRRAPAMEVLRGLDRVVGTSRRIVLSWGVRGDVEWRVPDTDPGLSVEQVFPDNETWYVVARVLVEFTPGCYFRLTGAAVPSGQTNRFYATYDGALGSGNNVYAADGPAGHVRVTVTWTDRSGSTEKTTHEVAIPGSTLEDGAQNTDAGGLWSTLRTFGIPQIFPPDCPSDTVEVRRWSQFCSAAIVVEVRGSPRIVDASISEIPIETAAADGETIASALFGDGSPDGEGPLHGYPYADDGGAHSLGVQRILDTARAQQQLGPCLVQWTGYTETNAIAKGTITARVTHDNGTTFVGFLNSTVTTFEPDAEAGWSVSCGGYARRWAQNSPFVLLDRIAVIPVLVRVYGRTLTAGVGTFRFQTSPHSYVDVPIPIAGSDAWVEAYGWLEVGITPDQRIIGQARINHSGASGSLSISAFAVYYCSAAAPV